MSADQQHMAEETPGPSSEAMPQSEPAEDGSSKAAEEPGYYSSGTVEERKAARLKAERWAAKRQMEALMPAQPFIEGEIVCVTTNEAFLRQTYDNDVRPAGDWWHPAIHDMLGQELPILEIRKGMVYLPCPDLESARSRGQRQSRQRYEDRVAFPPNCLKRIYWIGFELDGDEYTAKVLDKRLPTEAEVARKRGMTHLIEYVTGPIGPGGREWVNLDEDNEVLRDEYNHILQYTVVDPYRQHYRCLKNAHAWQSSRSAPGQQRKNALRPTIASRPADHETGSQSSGSSSFLDSEYDDLTSPEWSSSDGMSTTVEEKPVTVGRRIPPGGHCKPDLKSDDIVERLYHRDLQRQNFIQYQLAQEQLYQNHLKEEMCHIVERNRNVSPEHLDKMFQRLYEDSKNKEQRLSQCIKDKEKEEAETWKLKLPPRKIAATKGQEESDDESPKYLKMYNAGVQKLQEKAEQHAAQNKPRSWSPITNSTEVADRLHADYFTRQNKREATKQAQDAREKQFHFEHTVHQAPGTQADVKRMVERLYGDDVERRRDKRVHQLRLRDETIDQNSNQLSPRSPTPHASPERTQLLFEDAARRRDDTRLVQQLKSKQDEDMLHNTSVHKHFQGGRSQDDISSMCSRLCRSKGQLPGRAFSRMVRAANGIQHPEAKLLESSMSRQGSRSQSPSWSPHAIGSPWSPQRCAHDFSVGIFSPEPFNEDTEMTYRSRSHAEKRAYIGEAKLRAAMSPRELKKLEQFSRHASRERRAREERLQRAEKKAQVLATRRPATGSNSSLWRQSADGEPDQRGACDQRGSTTKGSRAQDGIAKSLGKECSSDDEGSDECEDHVVDHWADDRSRRRYARSAPTSPGEAFSPYSLFGEITAAPERFHGSEMRRRVTKQQVGTRETEVPEPAEVKRGSGSAASSRAAFPSKECTPAATAAKDLSARCEHCEAALTDDSRFCRQCGKKCHTKLLQDSESEADGFPKRSREATKSSNVGRQSAKLTRSTSEDVAQVEESGSPKTTARAIKRAAPDPHAGTAESAVSKEWADKEPVPLHGLYIHEDFGILHIGKDPKKDGPGLLLCGRPMETEYATCLRLKAWPVGVRSRCCECQKEWETWAMQETHTEMLQKAKPTRRSTVSSGEGGAKSRLHLHRKPSGFVPGGRPSAMSGRKSVWLGEEALRKKGIRGSKTKLAPMRMNLQSEGAGSDSPEVSARILTPEDRDRIRALRLGVRRFSVIAEKNEDEEVSTVMRAGKRRRREERWQKERERERETQRRFDEESRQVGCNEGQAKRESETERKGEGETLKGKP